MACSSVAMRAAARVGVQPQQPAGRQTARLAVAQPAAVRAASSRRVPKMAAALTEEPVAVAEEEMDIKSLYDEFATLLDQYDHNFKRGDTVVGTVFRTDDRGAYVDIGAKSAGYCSSAECSLSPQAKARDVLMMDSQREFVIIKDNAKDGEIQLSLRKMEYSVAWSRVRQMQEEGITVMGKVLSLNRGGLLVDVEHLRGFVPASQLSARLNNETALGQTIPLKFLEVDEERQRLVFSNRKAETDVADQVFKVGDVVEGTVESLKPYGAFVNLGNTNGLLHISQISHDRVTNVEAVLSVGDKLKVMVLSKDKDMARVALSTRKLEPSPGDMLRDPALVYAKADEMAAMFRERVAAAEAAARQEEERLTASVPEDAAAAEAAQ